MNSEQTPALGLNSSVSTAILDRRVRKFGERIVADPAAQIPALACELNLSVSWLQQLFKRQTGESMASFIIRRRMLLAAHLLRTTELRVKEVSARVGYRHPPSFDRLFSRVLGIAPKDYRDLSAGLPPPRCRDFRMFRAPAPTLCALCLRCEGTGT